jgi:hypothetical protein
MVDRFGLDPMAICNAIARETDSWHLVIRLRKEKSGKSWDRLGLFSKYCLNKISCRKSSPHGFAGEYHYQSGNISLYACAKLRSGVYTAFTESEIRSTLVHELSHAESLCRSVYETCEDCMVEEKKANWRERACRNNASYTAEAWKSCHFQKFCHGRSEHEFTSVGDPEKIPHFPDWELAPLPTIPPPAYSPSR